MGNLAVVIASANSFDHWILHDATELLVLHAYPSQFSVCAAVASATMPVSKEGVTASHATERPQEQTKKMMKNNGMWGGNTQGVGMRGRHARRRHARRRNAGKGNVDPLRPRLL
jgi:hypothetical protein